MGHAAGKSLFCRLIRFCLGENTFGDTDDTASIRARFPNGAVGAEVRIRGVTWAVRRRFTLPREDRAKRVESIELLTSDDDADGFEAFLGTLEQTVFDAEQRQLLMEMPEVQPWQFLLAWLTRDQECRIDSLTHWRHPDSSYHSPVRPASVESRLQVLRIVVGLYSMQASVLRRNVEKASIRNRTAETAKAALEARFKGVQEELAAAIDVTPETIWPPPIGLLQREDQASEAHRRVLLALADQKIRSVVLIKKDPAHARNVERLSEMTGRLARLDERIAGLSAEVDRYRERVRLLDGETTTRWSNLREAKHPVCPFDGTPLDVEASKVACPLVRLPDPAAAKRIAEETKTEWLNAQTELTSHETALGAARGEQASLKVAVHALARTVEARDAAVAAQAKASQSAWATKGLVHRVFELRAQLEGALRAEATAKQDVKARQDDQVAALSAHSTARLQRWFDFLVKRIVAPAATGSVALDGNGLHPKIEWRGTRRSVALNSLQVVLFDLAAMLCAVEGDSRAPAFLVHDSPREGDLDPWTYGRLFEAILELGPDEDTAPFQYIITTTTDPPEGLARTRVRLELGSDTEDRRLFLADL
jgi:lambda repressor-like predicted transcriptional regulator